MIRFIKELFHPPQKFYYGQSVTVVGGFYKGCTGTIEHECDWSARKWGVRLNGVPMLVSYQIIDGIYLSTPAPHTPGKE